MPVDYLTHEIYSVNYDKLYNELMENNFLDNIRLQSDFLNFWIEQLKKQDQIEVEQFKDNNFVQLMLKEDYEAPEKYKIEIVYNFGIINIHFRVTRIIQAIEDVLNKNDVVQYIPVNDFTKSDSNIKWDTTNLLCHIKNNPILLAPLTIDKYTKYIVIDGNHRLTAWIEDGKESIPCVILNGQWLIDNNMFCSGFSKLMYIFQNEIVALGTFTKRDHTNSILLMDKTFFRTGKLLYNV